MSRAHNFSAGPAVLPEPVLRQAQEAIWDFQGTGVGLLEMSHRSKPFEAVIAAAAERLGRLLGVTDTHHILFLQGGASTQFYQVPMNLLRGGRATYLDTGRWSTLALKEARRFGEVDIPFSSAATGYDRVPDPGEWGPLPDGTVYLHYTSNNTVAGSAYGYVPEASVPLVCDASSNILSEPWDAAAHGIIYAGAQKNLGPSGLTIVIIRKDLAERFDPELPTMIRYGTHITKESMFNTPPTFPIYIVERVAAWLEDQGGIEAMGTRNRAKAQKLYDAIDGSDFWQGKVAPRSRSIMNVTWTTGSPEGDTAFWQAAAKVGLAGLKGHKSVGGLRASIYNACPEAAIDDLVAFMRDFEAQRG